MIPPDVTAVGRVEIWPISLEVGESRLEVLYRLLSPDELERAARYRSLRDQRLFVARRGILRLLLADYLGLLPKEIRLSYAPQGKPALADNPESLGFNLSHSAGRALYAIVEGGQVGIDLEYRDSERHWESLAPRLLSEAERAHLVTTSGPERIDLVVRLWTRKEAFAKAVGWGLGRHPASIRTDPQASPSVILEADVRRRGRWLVHDLSPWPGFVGSVAVEEHIIVCMRTPDGSGFP